MDWLDYSFIVNAFMHKNRLEVKSHHNHVLKAPLQPVVSPSD